ncbi:MAG: DNA-directed RNA polymerase subunit A'' [Thermoproteus sp. AZ2]|jgi:DNA-directed RNA polymerase subunit A"|uniref:DNA-directed RNA polymerase subunit A n=1 Tax=Thermoproteus sp. AZ2 TaxID=1609232 RepID=A0ACC6V1A0_9CREN|nr:MAG: DNA-directed RNA polymerase subunit A'' [Thermoproteus sp. AZ2]
MSAAKLLEDLSTVLPRAVYEELRRSVEGLDEEAALRTIYRALRLYVRSLIDSGEAIGIVTAQSIGEPSTQMILRSFHFAGLREFSMARGLPRMIEIVDARRKPSTPLMFIYLRPPYNKSRDAATEVAKKIQLVTVENLSKLIDVDYISYAITIEIDPEQLKYRDLTMRDVEKALSKMRGKGVSIETEGNYVYVKLEAPDMTKLRKLRDKVLQTKIGGIKGIKKVLVDQDRNTGEWYIIAEGTNLEAVLELEEVDASRTYSNDLHEVAEVLGIEAARTLIAQEIRRVLQDQGLDVDIRHMYMVADAMTWLGKVRPIGRHGVVGSKESPLARAAFEVTVKTLVEAAVKGEVEGFRGVFENIIAGRYVPIGTGIVRLLMQF